MIVEMLALLLIAIVVFAYVLAPIVLPRREREIQTDEDASATGADGEEAEAVVPEKQPVHDLS
jgi:flagellar biosynthesis/type III secretory pathway M-ring protein FliF/YscJ